MMTALEYLVAVLNLAPQVISAGQDVAALASQALPVLQSSTGPSDADIAALAALEAKLRADLDAAAGTVAGDGAQ